MQRKPSPSLRLMLVDRLLPATLILMLIGAAAAYWIALRSATKAYDRGLLDTAFAISQQLHFNDGQPELNLTSQARAVLLADKFDEVFYSVRTVEGTTIAGEAQLPMPPAGEWGTIANERRKYYDGIANGKVLRLAAIMKRYGDREIVIIAAETVSKRNELVRDILFGMLLPEALLVVVSVSLVWFGVRSGLRPLEELREEIAGRSHADLRPLAVNVPEEMQPVVAEMNSLLQRLGKSIESQRNFVSDAAHQLRTPIAALQAQVEAVRQEAGELAPQQLDGIVAATQRFSHLISQMLVLAQAEPNLGSPQPPVQLQEMAASVAEYWLPSALARQIDLGFELSPACVSGNVVLLEELLGNLIDNALRHTPPGGLVTVACGEADGQAWLTVEDSGTGIPPASRERVFERFYRIDPSLGVGNGLGLAIVREIARLHGGEVSAEASTTLGGCLMRVSLPMCKKTSAST